MTRSPRRSSPYVCRSERRERTRVAVRAASAPTLAEAERRAIVHALRATGGAKKEAAKLLKTSRRTLYNKIRAYGLE